MNVTKKINVNFSSLVGLKAELLRKQAEVKDVKVKTNSNIVQPQLNKKRSKKIVTENKIKNKNELVDTNDIAAHKKSKLMLEAKSRLYDKLKKCRNSNDKFLVDFKNKSDESDEEFVDETISEKYPIEPEENWVEYQDCFGRTRKCLREDLQHMQKKDDLIKQEVMQRNIDESKTEENNEQRTDNQKKEPEIEIMRRKWEEQTQKLTNKFDIHYQDILFDEARTHGVGYYAFSQDEEIRAKQQENLTNLRKETETRQKEMKEIKELKEKMEQNRLKVARIRQRIRAGLPAEPINESVQEKELDSSAIINNNSTVERENPETPKKDSESMEKTYKSTNHEENNAPNERETDEDKIKDFEELLDKKNHWHVMSQEEWVDKCRTERVNEFAPIYDHFARTGFHHNTQNTNEQLIQGNEKNFNNAKDHCFQGTYKESSTNLYSEVTNALINDKSTVRLEDVDNHAQYDKNNPAENNSTNNRDNEGYNLSKNATKPILDYTPSSSNPLISPRAVVSYPLSHLSKNYSQSIYNHHKPQLYEQHKLSNDISLPDKNNITISNDNSIHTSQQQEILPRNIDEHSIVVGLKYLREKFEENHNK